MPNLFPANYESQTVGEAEIGSVSGNRTRYKQGVLYDIDKGYTVRDSQNKIMTATGIEAWKQWCFNCLSTERYSCAAYSTDFGIEAEKAMQAATREEAEALLSVTINEALLTDPYKRTKYISDIYFNWTAADSVEVSITIVGNYDATIDITIPLAA